MYKIGLVHLVRNANGLEPFEAFLTSYRSFSPQIEHYLIIVFKGFPGVTSTLEYRKKLGDLAHSVHMISDHGYDITTYFEIAHLVNCPYLCFLNSYSEVLASGWLQKLFDHVQNPLVGAVGATGSYESASSVFKEVAYLPLFRSSEEPISSILELTRRLPGRLRRQLLMSRLEASFPPFPNPHLRTNAFMIRRDNLLALRVSRMETKAAALRFESGRHGMTRQLLARGLEALIVGRDGRAYGKDRWYESSTFRSGDQDNLLVADNRTRQYADSDLAMKDLLSRYAWGKRI